MSEAMPAATTANDPGAVEAPLVRPQAALFLLCVAQLMLVLDFSIVNVALPAMERELGFTPSGLQWVVSAYALTFGGFLMLGGRAADLYGRRRVFVGGLALFSVASLLGGFARVAWVLVAARGLQGIGGALVSPAALSLLTTTFPEGPERNRAMGWFGTMSTIGFAVGMIVGGMLTDSVGWEWVMFVNVPVGVGVILLAPLAIPSMRADAPAVGFDFGGAALVTGASATLVYALAGASEAGWGSPQTLALLFAGAVQVVAFLAVEGRVKDPLIPLSVFRRRDLMGANAVGFLLAAAVPAMVYLLSLHMQQQLHYSPFKTGMAFLPHAVVAFFAARVAPKVVDRFGARPTMILGTATLIVGLLCFVVITPHGSYAIELLPGLIITAVGILFGFLASMIAATAGMPDEEQGLASGLLSTAQEVGFALGLAVVLNVVAIGGHWGGGVERSPEMARVVGYRYGFLTEAALAAVALLAAITLVRQAAPPGVGETRPATTTH